MKAPASPTSSFSPASTSSARSRLYLPPRIKVGALALCFVLMIGASVWAVLQPVRPDPMDSSWRASILYPHETNPFARLQAVSCVNEYACRLNSVAVNGTGDLLEVWAVGNVGLVLHRAAGQRKWEQLTINAVEESAPPKPGPSPTPYDKKAASARPTSTPTPTATATPTPDLRAAVPYLLGLSEEEARKTAESLGFVVSVEQANDNAIANGNEANQSNQAAQSKIPNQSAQQSAPPRQVVVRQSPEAKTLAPRKSTITITLGRAPRSAAGLLDRLLPTVYAAEPEAQKSAQAQPSRNRPQQTGSTPPVIEQSAAGPIQNSPLNDDLIYVTCSGTEGCRSLGRSGRVYKGLEIYTGAVRATGASRRQNISRQ
jgi:hypothetical protein